MRKISYLRHALHCATALGGLLAAQPALIRPALAQTAPAQSDSKIESIQQQIRALQTQLNQMKTDLASRDRAVKTAQQKAQAAQTQAQAAQAQAAQAQAAQAQAAQAEAARAAAIPAAQTVAAAPPAGPPLKQGQFRVGPLTVTLGGFTALEGVYRSRNLASSIGTSFNSIPLANNPNNHTAEFRETAQQSRLSLLTEGQVDDAQKLSAYVETDFLSAGSSSNSNQSNSYTLRLRQFWGNYDNTNWGLHVLGGQAWSLATMYRTGLIPRQENVPLTIDAQYVVGFNWERQAQLRVVKDFDDHRLWAGLSLEEPQTLFGSSAGPNCLTGAQATTATGGGTLNFTSCGGSNVNSIQAYSDNIAPDVIAKIAADPGWGHYELYGLLRFMGGRVSFASTGTGHNQQTTGEGVGGGMILPLIPSRLEFQLSGLVGKGVGRYGTSQLPDATFSPSGKIEPLSSYSVMGGFVGHPTPSVDLYAYAGAEGVDRKAFAGTAGYGNPAANLSGCLLELGTCSAVTSNIVEGTMGAWWRPIKSAYGTVQLGLQYAYVNRSTFSGVGATPGSVVSPSANENMFLFSVRYYPFQ
jgi:TolA-binding protein